MPLSNRQRKAVPVIVASLTLAAAARKIGVCRDTVSKWMQEAEFAAEVERQREEIAREAYGVLRQGLVSATEVLAGLLAARDKRIARLAANDIIGHALKLREVQELEDRVRKLEEKLAGSAPGQA